MVQRLEEELAETGLMPYVRDHLPDGWRTAARTSADPATACPPIRKRP